MFRLSARHTNLLLCFLLTLAVFSGFALMAVAQDNLNLMSLQKELEVKQAELDAFEPMLLDNTFDDETLFETRQSVKVLRARSVEIQNLVTPFNASVTADLADIGMPPDEESGLEEPQNIRDLREKLVKESLMIKGILKQAEALGSKSTRFLEQLAALRRGQFVGKILENSVSPFNAQLWAGVQGDKLQAVESMNDGWKALFIGKSDQDKQAVKDVLRIIGGAFLLLFILVVMVNTRLLCRDIGAMNEPKLREKLRRVGGYVLVSMSVAVLGLLALTFVAGKYGLLTQISPELFYELIGFSLFILYALTNTWLLMAGGVIRKKVGALGLTTVILFAIDYIFLLFGRHLSVPVELVIVQSFLSTTLFSALMLVFSIALVRRQEEPRVFLFKRRFFYVSAAVGVLIFIANALGYVALTRFVFEQTVMLANFLIAVLILRAMARPLLVWVEHFFYRNPEKEDNLALFWLSFLTDAVLIFVSLPLVAAIVGVEWEGIRLLIYQAVSGFKVGGITISLISLASAILLFIALLFITRFIQKVLSNKVLPKTRMEESVRVSFVQIFGYIGLTIAFMSAISSVGFDLSNLALIAGALSVGIGFGLQSIVSNFVSGLILLFERPIKVGDWVILSSGEGVVKRISVRATEIETLDRTSIIIPNSELISASVTNWTHRDRTGRLTISIGVSYSSDPHRVYDILLEVAKNSDLVLSSPLPSVVFKDFGDSALIFDLRMFIRNITDRYSIETKLRLEIWNKLKEEGIEIPFPQRDLHIRSVDGLNDEGFFSPLNLDSRQEDKKVSNKQKEVSERKQKE
jgi:small-conductance mechanosensitive channel